MYELLLGARALTVRLGVALARYESTRVPFYVWKYVEIAGALCVSSEHCLFVLCEDLFRREFGESGSQKYDDRNAFRERVVFSEEREAKNGGTIFY